LFHEEDPVFKNNRGYLLVVLKVPVQSNKVFLALNVGLGVHPSTLYP